MAVVPLSVPAGTYALTVYCGSDFIGEAGGGDPGVGVFIDGIYLTELVVTANGVTCFVLPLDGQAHSVDLYNGFQQNNVAGLRGTYVTAVSGKGVTFRAVATPTVRLAFYGDSITSGMLGAPMPQQSFFGRTRKVLSGRCSMEAWGGRRLGDDSGASGRTGLGSINALAARMVALVAGATTRKIVLLIGVNDWGNGPLTAATFQTAYASLLTAINAADSGALIYAVSLTISSNEAALGFNGDAKPAWRTATSNAAAGKPNTTFVDGTTLMVAGGLSGDGLHPATLGHQAIFDGTGGFGGATNLRAVLSI